MKIDKTKIFCYKNFSNFIKGGKSMHLLSTLPLKIIGVLLVFLWAITTDGPIRGRTKDLVFWGGITLLLLEEITR